MCGKPHANIASVVILLEKDHIHFGNYSNDDPIAL
jgi:hypothetical protein